ECTNHAVGNAAVTSSLLARDRYQLAEILLDVLRMPRHVLPVLVDLDSHRLRFHLLQKTNHIRIELPCAEPQPLSSVEFDV
ncbi:MAG: hypothetical protein ABFC92_08600, partial [Rectinema sp.]